MKNLPPNIYKNLFISLQEYINVLPNLGDVASYIPELNSVDENTLALHLQTVDNQHFHLGQNGEKFSIQSIAKVFALTLAMSIDESFLHRRVGVEPSGNAFNDLSLLERERGIPRNPFINAGALVVCDFLLTHLDDAKTSLLELIGYLTCNSDIHFSPRIALSEKQHGFRNAAHVNLMKSFGNIDNDVDEVLDLYFNLCSIEMTPRDLTQGFMFLANGGIEPTTAQAVVSASQSKRINALMMMCGFYDEAGEFAYRVGLPGKSGVGGGIVAINPGHYALALWSPKLNEKGNSYRGMKILEYITTQTHFSIF